MESAQGDYNNTSALQQSDSNREVSGGANQLARRPASQVISQDRGPGDSSDLQWTETGNPQRLGAAWGDDLDELKRRAQVAKRESQAKRKQIPPFVQKLAR